jgi:hypothetical protein
MYKLLTDETREKIEREYTSRRGVMALAAFTVILGVGIVALVPSYMLASSRLNEVTTRLEAMKRSPSHEGSKELQVWLSSLKQKITTLSPKVVGRKPYELFLTVLSAKSDAVRLTGVAWKKDAKGVTTLTVNGVADDRKSLLEFENRLNALGRFSPVTLPVSNFARDKDISFELSMSPLP